MIHLTLAHRALAAVPRQANAIRVFWWLSFELDALEYRPLKISALALALRMDRGDVCRALAILRRHDLIHRNGRAWESGPFTYRLIANPQPSFQQ